MINEGYFILFQIRSALLNHAEKHKSLTSHRVVRFKRSYRSKGSAEGRSVVRENVFKRRRDKKSLPIKNAPRGSLDRESTTDKSEQESAGSLTNSRKKRGFLDILKYLSSPACLHCGEFMRSTTSPPSCPLLPMHICTHFAILTR